MAFNNIGNYFHLLRLDTGLINWFLTVSGPSLICQLDIIYNSFSFRYFVWQIDHNKIQSSKNQTTTPGRELGCRVFEAHLPVSFPAFRLHVHFCTVCTVCTHVHRVTDIVRQSGI